MDFVFGEERVKNEESLLFAIHLFSLESAIYMINGVCLRLCTLHSDCIKMFIVSLRCVCVRFFCLSSPHFVRTLAFNGSFGSVALCVRITIWSWTFLDGLRLKSTQNHSTGCSQSQNWLLYALRLLFFTFSHFSYAVQSRHYSFRIPLESIKKQPPNEKQNWNWNEK